MNVLLDGGRCRRPERRGRQGSVRLFSAAGARDVDRADADAHRRAEAGAGGGTKANFAAYGLGFQLRDYKGRWWPCTAARCRASIRGAAGAGRKLGIAILTNAESGGALNALQYRLLDQYLVAARRADWIKLIADVEDEARQGRTGAPGQKAGAARAAKSKPSLPLAPTTASTRIRGTAR
jgi:hypothetical protein